MKPKDQENDWKFWVAVPFVVLVLWIGLRVFHRCFQLGRSLSVDGLAMIGTTLVAAAVGFLAIVYQVRSSSKQLRDQMWDQREAEREEAERQKRAIAAALLAEINDFYKFSLKGLWGDRARLRGAITGLMKPPPELGSLPSTALVLYRSTTHQLGALNVTTVKSVVGLYNFMASFIDTYEAYRRDWSPSRPIADPEMATKLRDIFDVVPKLILDCYRTCQQLAKEQAVPFEKSGFSIPVIGERNENGQTMKQALEDEAARIRQRLSTEKTNSRSDDRLDEITQNDQ